ncbi:hypothetical protein KR093_003283, partial [Drosophila rubida]
IPLQTKIEFPLHGTHLKKTLAIVRNACLLSLVASLCFHSMYNIQQINHYNRFYSNYDPIDAFDRMQSGGYLSSFPKEKEDSKDKK